jgi:uncharacterized protein YdhG (YjbR/CyaY superfamily)
MPAFEDHGRVLVYYAAFKDHCSLFPASSAVIERFADELARCASGKGTLRFTPDDPLPSDVVRMIVEVPLEENAQPRGGTGSTTDPDESPRRVIGHRSDDRRRVPDRAAP